MKRYNSEGLKHESISFIYKLSLTIKIEEDINGMAKQMYESIKYKMR